MIIEPIAYIHSPFNSKFGIPRQSGVVGSLKGSIVFEPKYRSADAIRGMEDFDYLWLIWEFSANSHAGSSLMVRPPRLGGNEKVGVFASRSPFRPNRLGMSSVKIDFIDYDAKDGPIINVLGADLMDGTPIYDIKPYVTYVDSHEGARCGFVDRNKWTKLDVVITDEDKAKLVQAGMNEELIAELTEVISEDPRPQYQDDNDKVYGMIFAGLDIHFVVKSGNATLVW
ncbi:tRNA (N6-threonylcarbamoyladenosine(37)-N6)-methyltransferase TrmO [Prevotella sp.]|uniref:tRNA (N6-threonylcarbamoyladenosine(37)-N6)-methyltransferase TrmO n=1 Tax=Prevotella sp. TaxID=59823 RepID=UPI002647C0AB|nr:tRNA (N6-threonylcarbamoyladenosine(37)-N6)-methyltransferase TrmO [Prevotella sp.]MDN5553819.1 tRNA (N6-threonylcarbamoyladenosine(37)-N6)-methyltransferase TrmO [Prevotella sp.]